MDGSLARGEGLGHTCRGARTQGTELVCLLQGRGSAGALDSAIPRALEESCRGGSQQNELADLPASGYPFERLHQPFPIAVLPTIRGYDDRPHERDCSKDLQRARADDGPTVPNHQEFRLCRLKIARWEACGLEQIADR